MRPCPTCETLNDETARFCKNCGTMLMAAPDQGGTVPPHAPTSGAPVMPSVPEPGASAVPGAPIPGMPAPGAQPGMPPVAPPPLYGAPAPGMPGPGVPPGSQPGPFSPPPAPEYPYTAPPGYVPPGYPGSVPQPGPSLPLPQGVPYVGASQPYQAPTPSAVLPGIVGPPQDPSTAIPKNPTQQFLKANLPGSATNPIVGALLGAGAAVIACIVLTFGFLLIAGSLINAALGGQGSSANVSGLIANELTANVLNIVAIEHHATLSLSASAAGVGGSVDITLPLTVLLLIPALALALGGYIAASTDYQNRVRYVLGRAGLVGPIYGVLLTLIIAIFGNQSGNSPALASAFSFGPSWPTVLLYGILWGTLFSMVGGLIKLFGPKWRQGAVTLLMLQRHPVWRASGLGALAAVGIGLLLMVPLVLFIFGGSLTSAQFTAALAGSGNAVNAPTSATSTGSVLVLVLVVFLLPFAVYLFAAASGASLGGSALAGVPLLNSGAAQSASITIFDSHIPRLALLLLLVPAIAYFCGGRTAARLLGTGDQNQRLGAGALMGVFSAALMFLLAVVTGISVNANVLSLAGGSADVGVELGSVFLVTLLFGTVLGIAGAFFAGAQTPRVTFPPLAALYRRYDVWLARPTYGQRPAARTWLYGGLTLLALMGLLSLVLDLTGGLLIHALPFTNLQGALALWGGLVLALPALVLIISWIIDLSTPALDPQEVLRAVAPPPPAVPVPVGAISQPYAYPVAPPSAPYPPPATSPIPPYTPPQTPQEGQF